MLLELSVIPLGRGRSIHLDEDRRLRGPRWATDGGAGISRSKSRQTGEEVKLSDAPRRESRVTAVGDHPIASTRGG